MASLNGSCTCGMSHEEEKTIFKPLEFVLENCATVGINIFGLFANSMAMVVLYQRNLQTLFMKTLFILAIFDLIFNICDILETIRLVYYDYGACEPMPYRQIIHLYLTPQLIRPLRMFVIVASMYTTVVVGVERYQAVSKPIITYVGREEDNWKKLGVRLSPVIIIALILTLPKSFEFFIDPKCFLCIDGRKQIELLNSICDDNSVVRAKSYETTLDCKNIEVVQSIQKTVSSFHLEEISFHNECHFGMLPVLQWTNILKDKTYYVIYRMIFLNIATYPIPLFMLFILNWLIYKHIQKRRKVINELGLDTTTSEVQNEGRRRQIREIHNMEAKQLRILFGVCLLFVVCHTCRIIRNLEDVYLRLIKGVDITTPSSWSGCAKGCASPMFIHMHIMDLVNKVLLAVSHSSNFIIYCFSFKNFRELRCLRFFRRSRHFESTRESVQERFQVFEEEMQAMQETLLSVHRAIDKPKLSHKKRKTGTYFNNISMVKIRADIEMELEHMLPHLDLAVGNNIQPTPKICSQNASVSCQSLRKKF